MDLTKKILERSGYAVRCVCGFSEARRQLMDLSPDGIILEGELSDGSGMGLCRELNARNGAQIMFISDCKDDELYALQAGASDYLKRPFDYELMKARIGIMLSGKADIQAEFESGEAQQTDKSGERGRWRKRYFYAVAVCMVTAFIGGGLFGRITEGTGNIDLTDNSIPLSAPLTPDENAMPYEGDMASAVEAPEPCGQSMFFHIYNHA